ncbi:phosphotransferase [Nocardia sp. NPDC059691]|uniref:phosphotransferase n=1 Tax=Nocardia sp. NPDC059691 TaxID=3346908 RepID=UPI00367FC0FB
MRAQVEQFLGGSVIRVAGQNGGFSQGIAARLLLDSGTRAFVKAIPTAGNPESVRLVLREAEVAAALPEFLPVPRLLTTIQAGGWIALLFTDQPGRTVPVPWTTSDTSTVLDAIAILSESCTPSPVSDLPAWGGPLSNWPGWRSMADPPDWLDPCWFRHLDTLTELEAQFPDAVAGSALLHSDLRSDNIILAADGVFFVDWAWAARGQGWVDTLIFALCGAVEGMPEPETVFASTPAGITADPAAVDSVLAALAGRFARAAGQPAPGMERLRAFQRDEARVALNWLATRRRWII